MERMTPKDAAILALEDDVSAAHGLTIGVFDGPEPEYDDLLALVEDRVRLIPRYRQRLLHVPFDLERPVWVDDPNFTLEFHLRHTALPDRKSRDPLNAFVSRCVSQRLDRGKPLWELWMVSGLPNGQWALASKVHYAIIDGVSGTDLLGVLTDDIDAHGSVGLRMPKPLPTQRSLVADALVDLAFDPMESFRTARSMVRKPVRFIRSMGANLFYSPDPNGLGRALGPHRKWQSAKVPLDALRKIRKRHHVSTTDVILAAVGGAIRHYLVENGRPIPTSINALGPLSVGAASGGVSGQVATLTGELLIAEPDPVERLLAIHAQTSAGAAQSGAIAGQVLRRQEHFAAPSILGQGVRSTMLETRTRLNVDTVAINVPGPAKPLTILGHTMVEAYPVIPLPGRVQIAVAALSLRDDVFFGITGDFDSIKGLRYASAGINVAIDELS